MKKLKSLAESDTDIPTFISDRKEHKRSIRSIMM